MSEQSVTRRGDGGEYSGTLEKGCFWKVTWMEDPSPSSISGFPLSDKVQDPSSETVYLTGAAR